VEEGAEIHRRDSKGLTPVMAAARGGHYSCLELLIQQKCNVNMASNIGETAIMLAVHLHIHIHSYADNSIIY